MKTCPKCKLDYCDEFSFCEFDGMTLIKSASLQEDNQQLTKLFYICSSLKPLEVLTNNFRLKKPLGSLLAVATLSIILILAAIYTLKPKSKYNTIEATKTLAKSDIQSPVIVETPKEALEFYEQNPGSILAKPDDSVNTISIQKSNQKESTPQRPGVVVFPHKTSKANVPTVPDEGIYSPPVSNPKPKNSNTKSESQSATSKISEIRQPAQKSTSSLDISAPSMNRESNQTLTQGIAIKIVRILTRQSSRGGNSYVVTFNVQNSSGNLIQWEHLTLTTQGKRNNLSTTSPFINRLGSPGNIIFTYKSPEFFIDPESPVTKIHCSLLGRTMNNAKVLVSSSIPTHNQQLREFK